MSERTGAVVLDMPWHTAASVADWLVASPAPHAAAGRVLPQHMPAHSGSKWLTGWRRALPRMRLLRVCCLITHI
jgi:hypothetical protein